MLYLENYIAFFEEAIGEKISPDASLELLFYDVNQAIYNTAGGDESKIEMVKTLFGLESGQRISKKQYAEERGVPYSVLLSRHKKAMKCISKYLQREKAYYVGNHWELSAGYLRCRFLNTQDGWANGIVSERMPIEEMDIDKEYISILLEAGISTVDRLVDMLEKGFKKADEILSPEAQRVIVSWLHAHFLALDVRNGYGPLEHYEKIPIEEMGLSRTAALKRAGLNNARLLIVHQDDLGELPDVGKGLQREIAEALEKVKERCIM